jgi:hypothetical protein
LDSLHIKDVWGRQRKTHFSVVVTYEKEEPLCDRAYCQSEFRIGYGPDYLALPLLLCESFLGVSGDRHTRP